MNVKKWMAGFMAVFFAVMSLALPLPGTITAPLLEAAASDTYPELSIEQKTLTVSEAAGQTVTLDVHLNSPSLTRFLLMLHYDESLQDVEIESVMEQLPGEYTAFSENHHGSDNYQTFLWKSTGERSFDEVILRMTFTLPEDVQPGDEFPVEYLPVSPLTGDVCEWNNTWSDMQYADSLLYLNGGIQIVEDEESETDHVELFIEQKTLTASEAAGQTVTLDVYLNAPGLTGIIMTLQYDERLKDVELNGLDSYLYLTSMIRNSDNFAELAWAAADPHVFDETIPILRITATLPEDVQPGDEFRVEYLPVGPTGISSVWHDTTTGAQYEDSMTYTNGGIIIAEDDEPDTEDPAFPWLSIEEMTLTASQAAGQTVTLDVYLKSPGLTGFTMLLQYDERLKDAKIKTLMALRPSPVFSCPDNYMGLAWARSSSDALKFDGAILRLTVTLPEDVQPGDEFRVEYLPVGPSGKNCEWHDTTTNTKYEYSMTYTNGGITIIPDGEAVAGDLNNDGTLELNDMVLLQRYALAAKQLTAKQLDMADLNNDGVCDVYDLALMKYALLS